MAQMTAGGGLASTGTRSIHTGQIFWASFLTLIAEGMGFGVRTGILADWGAQFGFTKSELGSITGGGLTGFGVTIIICSFFADRIGYKAILIGAFVLHVLSAVLTLCATPVFHAAGKDPTYWTLYIGMFLFALGNGLCEAAINPLVATLFPKNKTHYLNILHAGWPGGLVIGALIGFLFVGEKAAITHLRWEIPIATFLIPALWYGMIVLKNAFPRSETHTAGVSLAEQITAVLAPIFIFLIVIHAMVGYVELGTDSWIANILNNVVGQYSLLLFIYTSMLMFILRFFAGPIVHKINPLGLLFLSACLGATGLFMLGTFQTGLMLLVAGTVFALGKTFYWPTMLGVAGEQFPKSGALGMGLLGGFGMLSAGLLGGPGIGYKQDRNATNYLRDNPKYVQVYDRYKAETEKQFLFFKPIAGLDGAKVGVLTDDGAQLAADIKALEKSGKKLSDDKNLSTLNTWWKGADAAATNTVALAASKAKVDELSKGGDAAKLKKADEAADKAKKDAEAAKVDTISAGLAAAKARAGALSADVTPEKAKAAADASAKAEAAARAVGSVVGAKLGALAYAEEDRPVINDANIYGGQQALKITAAVPMTMALCYLILVLYFVSRGGYKQIHITGEQASGGVEGPME